MSLAVLLRSRCFAGEFCTPPLVYWQVTLITFSKPVGQGMSYGLRD